MEKSPSSVLGARVRSWLAPCGIALPLALAGCGGAASPAGTAKSAVAPTEAAGTKRHLTPELVATLPESFEETRDVDGEPFWVDRITGFRVRGVVFPAPFKEVADNLRADVSRENPEARIEDKMRGKEHSLEVVGRDPAKLQQVYLTLALVSDGKISAVVSCGGLLSSVRAMCKEAVDSVWFAPNERARPKAAPAGKRWLDDHATYVLVPNDFQPDPNAKGVGVMQGQNRVYLQVVESAKRISLADAMHEAMDSPATALGPETPLKRSVGFGSSIEAIHAVQLEDATIFSSRVFPISANATALTVCSAPERVFQAQPKRCAALLDAIEVVTPTPLVNARAEGGSVVR